MKLGGKLLIRVSGAGKERFLNLCATKGFLLQRVEWKENDICLIARLNDFYEMRPIVRKTKVKVAVLKRMGLPFFMKKTKKRWIFAAGAILAMTFWVCSGFFLWKIDYSGNIKYSDDQLSKFIKKEGIYIGKEMGSIDATQIERDIRMAFPDVTWVSVKINGTTMTVTVKENEINKDDYSTCNHLGMDLISPCNGIVTSMIVRSGVPKVKIGEEVSKDQVLISGLVPISAEDGTVREWLETDTDGDVIIEHLRIAEDAVGFHYEDFIKTGRSNVEYLVYIGDGKCFRFSKKPYKEEIVTETDVTPKTLRGLQIPVRIVKRKRVEMMTVQKKRSEAEVRKLLEEKILKFIETLEEKGVQIIEKNVKIDIEGDFGFYYGELRVREKAELYRKNTEGKDLD